MKLNITVPEDFSEVTVKQYKRMLKAWEKTEDPKDAAVAAVCALCDLEEETVNNTEWKDIEKVVGMLSWLISEPDPTKLDLPLQKRFTMDGIEYGFISDWTKLSVGEFADLETFCALGVYDNLEKVLAVIYRPIVETKGDAYQIDNYSPHPTKSEKMLGLGMDIAVGAMLFFYHIETILAKDTQQFSQAKAAAVTKYTTSGAGMASSTD